MNIPTFYDPARVGMVYRADVRGVMEAAEAATDSGARPAAEDDRRTLLLLVDPQVDFVHEDGSLSVPGAVDDMRRTIEWLYRNLEHVSDIMISMDSHIPRQIFYPGWWADADGNPPDAMTPISADDVAAGRWQPVIEPEWSRFYIRELERRAKKTLMIWPYHTMLGTVGHMITPALYEAVTYHSEVRQSELRQIVKGRIARTEYYSLFEPEVKVPNEAGGTLRSAILDQIAGYDRVYVAGQAKSHCVLESIRSMANYEGFQPGLLEKVRLLTDCTSAVAHPEIDFDAMADEQFDRFEDQGLQRVTSDDPVR
jgi:nicotinamidase-related amidase